MNQDQWHRVRRDDPCPICGKTDWCSISRDGSVACCARVAEGSTKTLGEAGWLHRLREPDRELAPRLRPLRVQGPRRPEPAIDLDALARRFRRDVDRADLDRLADDLGVDAASLGRLDIGWSRESSAWSFPMVDAAGRVRGFRLRTDTGRKFAVRGGSEGLFIPADLDPSQPLLLPEGPTDTAALLGLGFAAVGRPNDRGGKVLMERLVHRLRPPGLVVVADRDANDQGLGAANELARLLALHCRDVRLLLPPPGFKDVRAWAQAGATRPEVDAVIQQAEPVRVAIRIKTQATAPSPGGRDAG